MPKITPVDWKTLIRMFESHGCKYKRKKGSHRILRCIYAKWAVVIPEYDEIDAEIIKNNMRTAGMTRNEYFFLLSSI